SQEDIRRARALAAHMTAALEVSRNLLLSEQHRKRSESLTSLALEVGSLLRGPGVAHRFLERAAKIMGASDAALIILSEVTPTISILGGLSQQKSEHEEIRFARAVMNGISASSQGVLVKSMSDLVGSQAAQGSSWNEVTIAMLAGGSGEILGALCLADCQNCCSSEDQQALQAIAGQAAVSLENTQFFTRLEQSNRHWIEIFDSIGDFIVAHDASGNVLRVNRALADFIGVQPAQLIGLNMATLLSTGAPGALPFSCPFCRPTGDWSDEYVHPTLERTFLVSTSKVHGASSERLQ